MDAQSFASIMFDEKTIFGLGKVLVAVSSAVTMIWNSYIGVVLFKRPRLSLPAVIGRASQCAFLGATHTEHGDHR